MKTFLSVAFIACVVLTAFAQRAIKDTPDVQILKAEDRRDFSGVQSFLANSNAAIRARAALAAGRIGDEAAIAQLSIMLESDKEENVRATAAFALGEIESMSAANVIKTILQNPSISAAIRVRAVEAAGKIASANAKNDAAKELAKLILGTLESEDKKGEQQDRDTILAGLTATLRTRPVEADFVVAKFLTNRDPRVRSDAANTYARLRAKNANEILRNMLTSDKDATARAAAARALGAADDRAAGGILMMAAADEDLNVRVSAIRSLAALKEAKAPMVLLDRADKLMSASKANANELLEIATALGRLLENSQDKRATEFLSSLRVADRYRSGETEIALARISPDKFLTSMPTNIYADAWAVSAYAAGLQILAASEDGQLKGRAITVLQEINSGMGSKVKPADQKRMLMAVPDLARTLAAFKPDNLDEVVRDLLTNEDVFVRTAAAEIIGDLPYSKQNMDALKAASAKSAITDKDYNDAQLAILDGAFKLNKQEAVGILLVALNAQDYLVRKKAFDLLKGIDTKESPGVPTLVERAIEKNKNKVLPYAPVFGTKLGQILNSDADYRRAAGRKNGAVKAIITTNKGAFAIDLLPEDASLTVDNFIKLARANYFNGLEVPRVVANFVMQDGDSRGDGNGGPGWSIRCEINTVPFDRGVVGMALSGKDTGGSQWFATHSPQPHLDGGYTVFGKINEADMKIVDKIARGDKIISVKIVEAVSTRKK